MKPSRQEVYRTCSRTDADLSWPATVPGDNNGCSKGLRSNSVTGSLTPRQNQSPCRPHHHNRFIQPGAPREWKLSGTSGDAVCATLVWSGLISDAPDPRAEAVQRLQAFWDELKA